MLLRWSAVARRTRTPLLVAAGRRAALSLQRSTAAASTGDEDDDTGQDAAHWKTRAFQDKILQALQTYKKLEGDTLVPCVFVVPRDDDRWPKVMWGYRLGWGVRNLRGQLREGEGRKLPAELLNELEKLGFVRDVHRYQWDEVIMPALRRYYEVNSDLDVPKKFVVPRGDETWPEASWGWKLGFSVDAIRNKERRADQVAADRKELEKMGFCFASIIERNWKERVLPAIATYRREVGDCLVRRSFVVPSEVPWPEKTWGMNLGETLCEMRRRGSFFAHYGRDAEWLDTLGFNMKFSAVAFEKRVASLMELHASVTGSQDIPNDFIIPSKAPWPEEMWGVHLGLIVARNAHHLR